MESEGTAVKEFLTLKASVNSLGKLQYHANRLQAILKVKRNAVQLLMSKYYFKKEDPPTSTQIIFHLQA